MHKEQLTNKYIGFTLHEYENNILSWLKLITMLFEECGYPLKSVSYDVNYNKFGRSTLKTFYKKISDDATFPVDKLYCFTILAAENQNITLTDHYGCNYDTPSKELMLFFDSSYGEENILLFYRKVLHTLLQDKIVHGGYLFSKEGAWGDTTQNFYKEDRNTWWLLMKRINRDETFSKKNLYRHIYKQNILSKYHMEERFEGVFLEEWVKKNNYGLIEKIGMENWLWTVPEEKLYEIQVVFYDKHLLLGVK
jgi:hypothetical protein